MSYDLQLNDLVWAKMKGYRWWPGCIITPGDQPPPKKASKWVYFFGTRDYAWIEVTLLKPYEEFKEGYSKDGKDRSFKSAVKSIEFYIKMREKDSVYDIQALENDMTTWEEEIAPVREAKKSSITPKRPRENTKTPPPKKARKSSSTILNGNNDSLGEDLLSVSVSEDERVGSDSVVVDKGKDVTTSGLSFGFIGAGPLGIGMIRNLINSGHRVNLWNRSIEKCEAIKNSTEESRAFLVEVHTAPCDIVLNSDIIFSCVADGNAVRRNLFGNCGVVPTSMSSETLRGKGYVELTGIDPDTSADICKSIEEKGGRYLEAQLQGSRQEAEEGNLIVLTAGNRELFDECQSCFKAIGKMACYLGSVGFASKMNLVINLINSISLVGLSEAMVLADRAGLKPENVLKIFNATNSACPFLNSKAERILKREFDNADHPIEHIQKDIKLCLDLSDSVKQPLSLAATANEIFKHARRLGYDSQDSASVYWRMRH